MSKGEHRQFTAEQKLEILREAEQPGVTVSAVCRRHGLAPSVFVDRVGKRWRVYEVLPEDRAAICEFALQYSKIGYRKLTGMMVDENRLD